MHSTSITLLDRLRVRENRAAWDRFVDLYTPLLFHWARACGLQEGDAADLVQDVFLALLEKPPTFTYDPQRSFRRRRKPRTRSVDSDRQGARNHADARRARHQDQARRFRVRDGQVRAASAVKCRDSRRPAEVLASA
ncbi:MAG: hypothetical protein K2R98_26495 [Gemmataceae bacterium]|nr:hypothetical protein [Gemmataceae bacterium]